MTFPMNMKPVLVLILILMNCASPLLKKEDYNLSISAFQKKGPTSALETFPEGEKGSFITTMEKTYLSLLSGKPEIDELIRYSNILDDRVRFSVSREVKNFFYVETPDGYYASEHEIIWLHLLLSWGYSLREDYENARIHSKKSSVLLSGEFSPEGRFDDPFLRIILAYLWTLSGNWEDARVDFRKAHELDSKLVWCLRLSEYESPPAEMVLIFGGSGYEPHWDPDSHVNLIRGLRGLSFSGAGGRTLLYGELESGNLVELEITPDASNWYERHFIRDNEIHDLVKDSIYGQKVLATAVKGTVVSVGGVLAGTAVGILGIGVGAGMIYLAAECNCGDFSAGLATGGVIVALYGIKLGYEIGADSIEYAGDEMNDTLDTSDDYRFVRFLPEYSWAGEAVVESGVPLKVRKKTDETLVKVLSKKIGKYKNVYITYFQDTP